MTKDNLVCSRAGIDEEEIGGCDQWGRECGAGSGAGAAGVGLRGLTFALEGDARAVAVARRIAGDLGGEAFMIRKQSKPLYHALGSFSSPLLVMLLAQAEAVGRAAGLSAGQTRKVMRAILERTIAN